MFQGFYRVQSLVQNCRDFGKMQENDISSVISERFNVRVNGESVLGNVLIKNG